MAETPCYNRWDWDICLLVDELHGSHLVRDLLITVHNPSRYSKTHHPLSAVLESYSAAPIERATSIIYNLRWQIVSKGRDPISNTRPSSIIKLPGPGQRFSRVRSLSAFIPVHILIVDRPTVANKGWGLFIYPGGFHVSKHRHPREKNIITSNQLTLQDVFASLPFYREPAQLSGLLHEQDEIEAVTHILPTIRSVDYGGRLVVIREIYVVKYGPFISENEGHALLFLERNLSIPVPRLYAMYRNADKLYIVMQYIPGTELQDLWPSLSGREKNWLLGQLRSIFQDIRSLSPPLFYGSVEGGPVPRRYFYARDGNPAMTGPFGNEQDFSKAMSLRCSLCTQRPSTHFHPWGFVSAEYSC